MSFWLVAVDSARAQSGPPVLPSAATAQAIGPLAPRKSDPVCEGLFRDYIARQPKLPSSYVDSAVHLVALRGRSNGFWRTVVVEFKKTEPKSVDELKILELLGEMLRLEGNDRFFAQRRKRPGDMSAHGAQILLGPEVLDCVIERAQGVEVRKVDPYVTAVVMSHDPRGRDFLSGVLKWKPAEPASRVPPIPPRAFDWSDLQRPQFHAAVGLAELRDPAGVEWLIEHVGWADTNTPGPVDPFGFAEGTLGKHCAQALAELTGQPAELTQAEWGAWWAANRQNFTPNGAVRLPCRERLER